MAKKRHKSQYLASMSASLSALCLGCVMAWPTPVLPKFHNKETHVDISDDKCAWLVALAEPGRIGGGLLTRYLSDNFGRKQTILASVLPMALGTTIVVFSSEAWLLFVARTVWGFAGGMLGTVVGMYIAEIADKNIRGTLASLNRVFLNLGSLLTLCVGPFVSYITLNRLLFIMPPIYFLACLWIPESPYYHLKDGRIQDARNVFTRLNESTEVKVLEEEFSLMQQSVRTDMQRTTSCIEFFTARVYRKAIIIAAGLKIIQMMTGFLTIRHFLGRIMQESSTNISLPTAMIAFGFVRFSVGFLATALVDRVGRRPLLILSCLGVGVSLTFVGIYFFIQEVLCLKDDTLKNYSLVPFAGIISTAILSTIGIGSMVSVIPAEIFPINVKALAMSMVTIFGSMLSFIVSLGYQAVKDAFGLYAVFLTFAVSGFCGAVFVYFFIPETKAKTLSEIQLLLQGPEYLEINSENLKRMSVLVPLNLDDKLESSL